MAREEPEEEKPKELICSRCERICDPIEVETCPSCLRLFCIYCNYRIGGRDYCSRGCGDGFFFGGDFGEDDAPEE